MDKIVKILLTVCIGISIFMPNMAVCFAKNENEKFNSDSLSGRIMISSDSLQGLFVCSMPKNELEKTNLPAVRSVFNIQLLSLLKEAFTRADPAVRLTRQILANSQNKLEEEVEDDAILFEKIRAAVESAKADKTVEKIDKNDNVKRGDILLNKDRLYIATGEKDIHGWDLFLSNQEYFLINYKRTLIKSTSNMSNIDIFFFERVRVSAVISILAKAVFIDNKIFKYKDDIGEDVFRIAQFLIDKKFPEPERLVTINRDNSISLNFSWSMLNAPIDFRSSSRVIFITDKDLKLLPALESIVSIDLSESNYMGKKALKYLLRLRNLRWLSLGGVQDVIARDEIDEFSILNFTENHPSDFLRVIGDFGPMFAARNAQYIKFSADNNEKDTFRISKVQTNKNSSIWIGQIGKWAYGFRIDNDNKVFYQRFDTMRGYRKTFENILNDEVILYKAIRVSAAKDDNGKIVLSFCPTFKYMHEFFLIITDRYTTIERREISVKNEDAIICRPRKMIELAPDNHFITQAV